MPIPRQSYNEKAREGRMGLGAEGGGYASAEDKTFNA